MTTSPHLMLDIESLGTRSGSVVLSVALVRFTDEAHCTVNLSISDQLALGMEIDPATHAWWGEQDAKYPGAWQRVITNPQSLAHGLRYIAEWIAWAVPGGRPLIWAHGATFDPVLLGEVYRRDGRTPPWQYWDCRDTRTLYDLAGINVKDYAVPPPHVALNDALAQTRAANDALRILARAHAVVA